MDEQIDRIINEISEYEVTEMSFRKSCCTAWDLCNHIVKITFPQELWTELKLLLKNRNLK